MRIAVAITALVAAMTASIAFAAPTARPFASTVAPFDLSPNILPTKNIPKKWIRDIPAPNGNLYTGGPGGGTRQFYEWLYVWFTPWVKTTTALNRECETFQETVAALGDKVAKRIEATTHNQLVDMNEAATGNTIRVNLDAYNNARASEKTAGQAVDAAMKRVDAAIDEVRQNEELIAAQADADRKAALAAQEAAIRQKIAESKQIQEIFTTALGEAADLVAIVQDPVGNATKIFGKVSGLIIGGAIDEHQTELMIIGLRMQALDEAIAKHQKGAMEAGLSKARKLQQAAGIEYVQRILEQQQFVLKQSQAIQSLATIEEGLRRKQKTKVDLFWDLRSAHEEFLLAGRDLRNRLARYQVVLYRGPGRLAIQTLPELTKSIGEVSRYEKPDQEWIETAKASRDYMSKYADWYPKERDYTAKQVKALNDRVEVLPIDDAVAKIIAKF